MKLESICVYCGSQNGNDPEYLNIAQQTGAYLAQQNIRLIYGGGRTGLMGATADACLAHGGEVIGIIPDFLKAREVAHPQLTELIVVKSMHERKLLLNQLSAAFLTLPGGIGTLEELAEIWSWTHLGLQNKPIGLLNLKGYFNHLLQWFDTAIEAGFMPLTSRNMILVENQIPDLIQALSLKLSPPEQTQSVDPTRF